jgi:hypothetical protein
MSLFGILTFVRPGGENTANVALRRLGYTREEMTGHGLRSTASTLLDELGWPSDAIERQLSHGERDEVRGAYNFAKYLAIRRRMMQAWADHLDASERGARGCSNAVPKGELSFGLVRRTRASVRHDQGMDGLHSFPDTDHGACEHGDELACARVHHEAGAQATRFKNAYESDAGVIPARGC